MLHVEIAVCGMRTPISVTAPTALFGTPNRGDVKPAAEGLTGICNQEAAKLAKEARCLMNP